jgi:Flp pilus assembly protein TadG
MSDAMKSMSGIWFGVRRAAAEMFGDRSGIAATEFALIVPIMLVAFFGTVELSSGVAVDRKVSLMARTVADLTSQSSNVADTDLTNFFAASCAIMTPYSPTPTQATISELYVDPSTLKARVEWSRSATVDANCNVTLGPGRAVASPVTIPAALATGGTYLMFSEVSYLYTPTVGYVMAKTGVTLNDVAYARPRQSVNGIECVIYPTGSPLNCPTL